MSSDTAHRRNRWTLLVLMVVVLPAVACGSGNVGNGDGSPGGDGGVRDATGPDAWTYECPDNQPPDHVCLQGQVRSILDDLPVSVPPGTTITRYIHEPQFVDGFPTVVDANVEVQPDGRFIFPSVPISEVVDDKCNPNNGECDLDWPYDQFDLMLEGDIPGFVVPDNKYGFYVHGHYMNYYVVPDAALPSWEASWPASVGLWCDGSSLDVTTVYKLAISVCYWGTEVADNPTLVPTPEFSAEGTTLESGIQMCWYPLHIPDRLTVGDYGIPTTDYTQWSGVGLTALYTTLQPGQHAYATCRMGGSWTGPYYPAFGRLGAPSEDRTGSIVVAHRWIQFRNF